MALVRLIAVAGLIVSACAGGTAPASSSTEPPASAVPAASPTSLAGGGVPTAPPPSGRPPVTPEPVSTLGTPAVACADCWPLSGEPLAGGSAGRRPLVVKIDSDPAARPHYGITRADLVFETVVEGFVTRLTAIFHSQDPETMASVRSARLSDRSLAPMVRGALVHSGTSAYANALMLQDARQGRYVDLSADRNSNYWRLADRPGPYDMYTTAAAMRREIARVDPRPVDVPRWEFIRLDHPPAAGGLAGAAAAGVIVVPYREDRVRVTYEYNDAMRTYARWQNESGRPVRTVDALGDRAVAVANVVVVHTEIWEVPEIVDAAGNRSHDMRLVGTGPATVFRDGLRQDGTWARPNDLAPFTFRTPAGEKILLSPGQTWVHVIPTDWKVVTR